MAKITFDSILFNLHILVFILLIIPVFFPLSLWPSRIEFHFWVIVITLASEILMGIILLPWMIKNGRYRIVCPLTTWMQHVRGYSPKDPNNFDHSFVKELGEKMNFNVPKGSVTAMNVIILIIATILYINR